MISKYRGGVVPEGPDRGLEEAIDRTLGEARTAMRELRVHEALAAAMDLARIANGYVEERAPWSQAKDPAQSADLSETLASLARVLVVLCALFEPVTPGKMALLAARLGLEAVPTLDEARHLRMAGRAVQKGDPLFPRVEPSWAVAAEGE